MTTPDLTREPLVVRTLLTAFVTALVHVAVVQGWVTVEAVSPEVVAGLVDALGVVIAALWSRAAVTPVADPVLQSTIEVPLGTDVKGWADLLYLDRPATEPVTYEPTGLTEPRPASDWTH